MKKSKTKLIGWILSGLLAAFLIFASASGKLTEWEGKEEMFAKIGWSPATMFKIGILEVIITILFLIPRTAFLGTLLLTAYLGGATATHIRVEDPFFMPIIIGIFTWIAFALRDRRVLQFLFANPAG